MRDLMIDQSKIWYSAYEGKAPVLVNGFETGQNKVNYSDPVPVFLTVSLATGDSETELFGASVQYDKVLSSTADVPIDEFSRLWIDTVPELNEDGSLALNNRGEPSTPHDYVVERVAKGKNQNLWAVRKVV